MADEKVKWSSQSAILRYVAQVLCSQRQKDAEYRKKKNSHNLFHEILNFWETNAKFFSANGLTRKSEILCGFFYERNVRNFRRKNKSETPICRKRYAILKSYLKWFNIEKPFNVASTLYCKCHITWTKPLMLTNLLAIHIFIINNSFNVDNHKLIKNNKMDTNVFFSQDLGVFRSQ